MLYYNIVSTAISIYVHISMTRNILVILHVLMTVYAILPIILRLRVKTLIRTKFSIR